MMDGRENADGIGETVAVEAPRRGGRDETDSEVWEREIEQLEQIRSSADAVFAFARLFYRRAFA